MPFLIENIIATVTWLIIAGLLTIVILVASAIERRLRRQRYFTRLDSVRRDVAMTLDPVYNGDVGLDTVVSKLGSLHTPYARAALEEYIVRRTSTGQHLALSRTIAERLGWIEEWCTVLRSRGQAPSATVARLLAELGDNFTPPSRFGRLALRLRANFLIRCHAANRLSRFPTVRGILALVAGTLDQHPEVREVCIRSLGRLADRATMPVLVAELIEVLEGRSELSVRTLKTALVRFPLEEIRTLQPALEHPNGRVRFFAVDIIREIVEARAERELLGKNDFPPEIHRLFSQKLYQDEFDDVRARTALVVAHFRDADSEPLLRLLMKDPVWFVRLHACRALGHQLHAPLAPELAERVSDSHWLVREAAVRSLRLMGAMGIEQIIKSFISTSDTYAAEQIAEEMQRAGILISLIAGVETNQELLRLRDLVRRMVGIGKVSMLHGFLLGPLSPDLKVMLIRQLAVRQTPELGEALTLCIEQDSNETVRATAAAALSGALNRTTTQTQAGSS